MYEEALNAPVDELPLTPRKVRDLKENEYPTVKHVMMAEPSDLRAIRSVGAIWAARIKTAAEEYVSV